MAECESRPGDVTIVNIANLGPRVSVSSCQREIVSRGTIELQGHPLTGAGRTEYLVQREKS